MQIVIELDDKTWRKCVENDLLTIADLNKFIVAIGNGTPLKDKLGNVLATTEDINAEVDKILEVQE